MKIFYMFRTNLTNLEYYHEFKTLEEFELSCHDYYLLMPLYFLKKNLFRTAYIIRLSKSYIKPITFTLPNGNEFIQIWVKNLNEIKSFERPDVSFFRGGFTEYDAITKLYPKFLGLKCYLGSSKRIFPQYGGKYDINFIEEDKFLNDKKCKPFFKVASPYIFKKINDSKSYKYDICWPCNFTQLQYKGQEFIISKISTSKYLKSLKIIHIGNKPEIGKELCKKYKINNIEFKGSVNREDLNIYLNESKMGLVASNLKDGCPRVLTEILCSNTPLLIYKDTRFLNFYKDIKGVIEFNENNLEDKIKEGLLNLLDYEKNIEYEIKEGKLNFEKNCKMNYHNFVKG